MIDTLLANLQHFRKSDFFDQLPLEAGNYPVLTLHCPANVDIADKLSKLFQVIADKFRGLPVVFDSSPYGKDVLRIKYGYKQFIFSRTFRLFGI